MKLRTLTAAATVAGLFLFAGMLYAANGDLIVNGNLGVGKQPTAKAEIDGNMIVGGNATVTGNLVTNGTTTLSGTTTMGGSTVVNGNLLVSTGTTTLSGIKTTVTGTAVVNGNLGVGTSTPTQKLDVNGAVKATGYYSGSTPGVNGSLRIGDPCNPPCTLYTWSNGILISISNCASSNCSYSCFRAGTNILLADGSIKRIEDVAVGDELLGENGSKNKVLALDRHPLGKRNFYSINKGPYFVTEDHPFMTTAGWKSINPSLTAVSTKMPVGKLGAGDTLLTRTGLVKVDSVADQGSPADTVVYNFVLDGTKSYYADGFLVRAYNDKAGK